MVLLIVSKRWQNIIIIFVFFYKNSKVKVFNPEFAYNFIHNKYIISDRLKKKDLKIKSPKKFKLEK